MHNPASTVLTVRRLSLRTLLALTIMATVSILARSAAAQTMQLVEDRNTQARTTISTPISFGDWAAFTVGEPFRRDTATWLTDGQIAMRADPEPGTPAIQLTNAMQADDWIVYMSRDGRFPGVWARNPHTGQHRRLATSGYPTATFGTIVFFVTPIEHPRTQYWVDLATQAAPVPVPAGVRVPPRFNTATLNGRVFYQPLEVGMTVPELWSFDLESGTFQRHLTGVRVVRGVHAIGNSIVFAEGLANEQYCISRYEPASGVLDRRLLVDLAGSSAFGFTYAHLGRLFLGATIRRSPTSVAHGLYRFDPSNGGLAFVEFPGRSDFPRLYDVTSDSTAMYFAVNTPTTGYEAHRLTTTSTAPEAIAEIGPGSVGGLVGDSRVLLGSSLFVVGTDPEHGAELWVIDTVGRTARMVKDINPGPASSTPYQLVGCGNAVIFKVDGAHGPELWRSDGTESGTFRVHDFTPEAGNSNPQSLHRLGDTLVYTNGPLLAANSQGVTNLSSAFEMRTNRVLAVARDRSGHEIAYSLAREIGSTSVQLLTTDGMPIGTRLATPPGMSAISVCSYLTNDPTHDEPVAAGLGLLLSLNSTSGCDPWVLDRTNLGPSGQMSRLVDLAPSNPAYSTNVSGFASTAGSIFFVANTPEHGSEIWHSDGTPGSGRVIDITPGTAGTGPSQLTPGGDSLYFISSASEQFRLMKLILQTEAVTTLAVLSGPGYASNLAFLGDQVTFFTNSAPGRQLWSVNVSTQEARLIMAPTSPSVFSGYNNGSIESRVALGKLFFLAGEVVADEWFVTLFCYDPDSRQTSRLARAHVQPNSVGDTLFLTTLRNQLLFAMNDGVHGQELWITDGTPEGTRLWLDAVPGPASSSPTEAAVVGDTLYLAASTPEFGGELYKVHLCPADLTLDFAVTIDDLLMFLLAYENGDPLSDIGNDNGAYLPDGSITIDDLLLYLSALERGC